MGRSTEAMGLTTSVPNVQSTREWQAVKKKEGAGSDSSCQDESLPGGSDPQGGKGTGQFDGEK